MDMFGAHVALDYFHALLLADLFYQIAESYSDIAGQHWKSVFGYPAEVKFMIVDTVGCLSFIFHMQLS